MARNKQPKLPKLLDRKIYKTGQTRGADDDVIYQNRVSRSSTVLMPFGLIDDIGTTYVGGAAFENSFIVLIQPGDYFGTPNIDDLLAQKNLILGENLAIFYQIRADWENYNPERLGWLPCNSRASPLGGQYVARIAATTAVDGGQRINRGFTASKMKGAGIRLFEYAPSCVIVDCRIQLEALFWLCHDSMDAVTQYEMGDADALKRKEYAIKTATDQGLLDFDRLQKARLISKDCETVCPLCLKLLSAHGFFSRLAQATGREVHDLTVTEINLFHINELRYGLFNHRTYNLGWGHHHCNVVVKDAGIYKTIEWMDSILRVNEDGGYYNRLDKD